MRTTFAEDLSPQGPVVSLDTLIDGLRCAVTTALSLGQRFGSEVLVAELETSFDDLERTARAETPPHPGAMRAVRELRALLWAMLPLELYPSATALRQRWAGA